MQLYDELHYGTNKLCYCFPLYFLESSRYCFCRTSSTRRLLKYSTYFKTFRGNSLSLTRKHTQLAMHASSYFFLLSKQSFACSGSFSTATGSTMFKRSRHAKYSSLSFQQTCRCWRVGGFAPLLSAIVLCLTVESASVSNWPDASRKKFKLSEYGKRPGHQGGGNEFWQLGCWSRIRRPPCLGDISIGCRSFLHCYTRLELLMQSKGPWCNEWIYYYSSTRSPESIICHSV